MKFLDSIKELLCAYLLLVMLCAEAYGYFESKPLLDSIWWACVTAMTVGYGDMYPATVGGKVIAVVLMHLSVLLILPLLIGNVCSRCIKNEHEFSHGEQEEIKSRLANIEKLLTPGENHEKVK